MKTFNFYRLRITLALLSCFSWSFYAQHTEELKTIYGKITQFNEPVSHVNISIKGTQKGVQTNNQGFYSIKAKKGDILQYSYVGFQTVTVVVEDVTAILNIEMDNNINELDEVVVKAKNSGSIYQKAQKWILKLRQLLEW